MQEGKVSLKNLHNKIYTNKKIEYVHWNNIKELIGCLQLLWSSKLAGHTGDHNEILSIIEHFLKV